MGVYKRLADMPEPSRLSTFEGGYEGRDVWAAYSEEYEYTKGTRCISGELSTASVATGGVTWRR